MPANVKILRIGDAFVPELVGAGLHCYEVNAEGVPRGAKVIDCRMSNHAFLLLVEHPDFPVANDPWLADEIEPKVCQGPCVYRRRQTTERVSGVEVGADGFLAGRFI